MMFLAASLAQASPDNSSVTAASKVEVATLDAPVYAGAHRAGATAEHPLKSHRENLRATSAVVTPVIFPSAQAAVVPNGGRGGELKGWVLLLMGAFLIATISQRRYQALSDL